MDTISVIIPVYNAEPFLRKCLDSVICQTYSNIEVIVVNDGSTDKSGEICGEYSRNDDRVKVFHKPNGGESSARNLGLAKATGRYIGFVDCDDWIDPNLFDVLHSMISQNDVDVCAVSYCKETGSLQIPVSNKKHIPGSRLSCDDLLVYAYDRDNFMGFCFYLWCKLFRADTIKKHNLCFQVSLRFGGDVLFYNHYIVKSNATGLYNELPLYHWNQREDSTSHRPDPILRMQLMHAYKEAEAFLNASNKEHLSFWARGFYCHHAGVAAKLAYEKGDHKMLLSMQGLIIDHIEDYVRTNRDFPHNIERMKQLLELRLH